MTKLRALAAIAAVFATAGSASEPELFLPTDNPATTEVVAGALDRYRRMTVPVTIDGHGPYQFMIDTGSQATVVTRRIGELLKLPSAGRAMVVGMASSEQVDLVRLDGLEFAARVFDNLHAPLLEAQNIGADGILGLDSLQDLRVLIDFRSQEISVDDADNLGGNRGYEIVVRARNKLGRLIITQATVDGIPTEVIIDTGAQGSMGNLALKRKLRAKREAEVTATDVHGNEIIGVINHIRTLEIGRMQLNSLFIAFADAPAFKALGMDRKPALVLGMDDLRTFDRVAIDFSSRRVLFDLPSGAARNDPMRFGISASRL